MEKTTFDTSGQSVQKSPEGLFLQDGIAGLRSLPRHSVDMLLTDPPYGTTRNFWDVPLPLPELWEAVKWAVKPEGAVLFFAQCPYDKVLGASNLPMLRYEWVWYKSRCTGFLNARRAPLKKTENILVFYQKLPLYNPQFEQGKPYKKIAGNRGDSTNYGKFQWSCASISSRPIPGPARWWRTSALAPAQRRWPPSTQAAALFVLKPSRPTMPPPASASVQRGRRWRLGRKESDYRTVFYYLCRSPLALHSEKGTGGGGKPLSHHEHIGAMRVACGRPCGQGQRAFFVGHIPAAPGGPAADPGVGLHL